MEITLVPFFHVSSSASLFVLSLSSRVHTMSKSMSNRYFLSFSSEIMCLDSTSGSGAYFKEVACYRRCLRYWTEATPELVPAVSFLLCKYTRDNNNRVKCCIIEDRWSAGLYFPVNRYIYIYIVIWWKLNVEPNGKTTWMSCENVNRFEDLLRSNFSLSG